MKDECLICGAPLKELFENKRDEVIKVAVEC